jgi:M6 family metalloprotease-like protein
MKAIPLLLSVALASLLTATADAQFSDEHFCPLDTDPNPPAGASTPPPGAALRFPTSGSINALVVFVQHEDDTYEDCRDYSGIDPATQQPQYLPGSACAGPDRLDAQSFTDDPVTEWPLSQMPGWASTYLAPPGTSPSAYPDGSLSAYYDLASGGRFQVTGHVYPDLYIPDHDKDFYKNSAVASGFPNGMSMVSHEVLSHVAANPRGLSFPASQFDQWTIDGGVVDASKNVPDGKFDMIILAFRFNNLNALGFPAGPGATAVTSFGAYWGDHGFANNPISIGGLNVTDNLYSGSGIIAQGVGPRSVARNIAHEFGHRHFGYYHSIGSDVNGERNYKNTLSVMGATPLMMGASDRIKLGWLDVDTLDVSGFSKQAYSLGDYNLSDKALYIKDGPPAEGDLLIVSRTASNFWDRAPDGINGDGDLGDPWLRAEGVVAYRYNGNTSSGAEPFYSLDNTGTFLRQRAFAPIHFQGNEVPFTPGEALTPFSYFNFPLRGGGFNPNPANTRLGDRFALTNITATTTPQGDPGFSFTLWSDFLNAPDHDKTVPDNYSFGELSYAREDFWILEGRTAFGDLISLPSGSDLQLNAGAHASSAGDVVVGTGATLVQEDNSFVRPGAFSDLKVYGTLDSDRGRVFNNEIGGALDWDQPARIQFYNGHTVLPGRTLLTFPGQIVELDETTTFRLEGSYFTRYGGGSDAVFFEPLGSSQAYGFEVADGGELYFQAGRTEVSTGITVEAGGYVSAAQGAVAALGPDEGITFSGGNLSANGATFTASDPAQGWGGLRFIGPTGACTGTKPYSGLTNVLVEKVDGNAIYARDASVGIVGSTIDGSNISGNSGVYATGCASVNLFDDTTVRNFALNGVLSYGASQVTIRDAFIQDNGQAAVLAQNGALAYVASSEIARNARGFEASGASSVLRAHAGGTTPPAGQNNLVEESSDATLSAGGKGYVEAGLGQSSLSRYNNLDNDIGNDAYVADKSTAVAEYNYWGDACGPTSVTLGGALASFDGAPWLTGPPPALSTSLPCGSGSRTAGDKGVMNKGGSSLLRSGSDEVRAASLALEAGQLREAALLLRQAVLAADAGEGGYMVRQEAFAVLPALVRAALEHENQTAAGEALSAAQAFLAEHAAVGAPHRALALRASAAVALVSGQADEALAAAEALLALDDADHADAAHALRVGALLALGRAEDAVAAQEAAEVDVAGTEGVALVAAAGRDLVYALAGSADESLARELATKQQDKAAATPSTAESIEGAEAASRIGEETPAELALGSPYPNPTTAGLTLALALPTAAEVSVTVYDVLGRAALSAPARSLAAGRHTLQVDASVLAPGAYVARVVVAEQAGERRPFTRRLTVAR